MREAVARFGWLFDRSVARNRKPNKIENQFLCPNNEKAFIALEEPLLE